MHSGDTGLTPPNCSDRLRGKQGVLVLLGDRHRRRSHRRRGADLKIIANVAVGYDNLDVAHARSRGIVCTNTPDVLDRRRGRLHLGADPGDHAPARGRASASCGAESGRDGRSTSCWARACAASSSGSSAPAGSAGAVAERARRLRHARGRQQPPAGGLAGRRVDVVRSPARHLRRREPARAAHAGDAEADRPAQRSRG